MEDLLKFCGHNKKCFAYSEKTTPPVCNRRGICRTTQRDGPPLPEFLKLLIASISHTSCLHQADTMFLGHPKNFDFYP